MNLEYDRSYSVPQQNPTKSGYVFEGWYTQKTDGTQVTSLTLMSTPQNHTLYARWRKIEKTAVTVGGVTLTYEGAPVYAKTDSEGKVTKDGSSSDYNIMLEEGELTLKNATICSQNTNGALYTENALVIKLEGTNTVTSTTNSEYGIYVYQNNLTIQGDGSLTVTAGTGKSFSDGIYAREIVIDEATVHTTGREATSQSRGILCSTKVIIRNGAKVTAAGGTASKSYGIWCRDGITIDNSSCTATGSTRAITMETSGELKLINAHLTSGSENGTSAEWIPQN